MRRLKPWFQASWPICLVPQNTGRIGKWDLWSCVRNLQGSKREVLADWKHSEVSKCKKHLSLSKLVRIVSTLRENSGLDYSIGRLECSLKRNSEPWESVWIHEESDLPDHSHLFLEIVTRLPSWLSWKGMGLLILDSEFESHIGCSGYVNE